MNFNIDMLESLFTTAVGVCNEANIEFTKLTDSRLVGEQWETTNDALLPFEIDSLTGQVHCGKIQWWASGNRGVYRYNGNIDELEAAFRQWKAYAD